MSHRNVRNWRSIVVLSVLVLGMRPQPAIAQQSVSDVLSLLLTNQTIRTDDFVRDEQAAAATRETISSLLLLELVTLPVSSSTGGFTYRLNRTLGTVERSSNSFGPFFVERSLTAGRHQAAFVLSYQSVSFDTLDGRNLRDGTLVSTASTLRGQALPFDIETLALNLRADTLTLSGSYGVTDRLDLGAAVPFVTLHLSGQRVDTYHGTELLKTVGSASASAPGDVAIRVKYNMLRRRTGGFAIGSEARLPTGNNQNLLGAGKAAIKPLLIASMDEGRLASHVELGYTFGGLSKELDYGAAVTVSGARVTWIGEIMGRRVAQLGRLIDTTEPNPGVAGVDTIRLSSAVGGTDRILAVAGIKWNFASTWLLSGSVIRPLTTAGLNAPWIPTVTFDYSFSR